MMLLDEFLEGIDSRPWRWGSIDCLMRCADWAEARTGADPAQGWRGKYSTANGAWRIVAEAGGMVAHVARCLEPKGWSRTEFPETGDIGVVTALSAIDGKIKEIGAIRYGPWWSVRGEDFIAFAEFPTIAAWTYD